MVFCDGCDICVHQVRNVLWLGIDKSVSQLIYSHGIFIVSYEINQNLFEDGRYF